MARHSFPIANNRFKTLDYVAFQKLSSNKKKKALVSLCKHGTEAELISLDLYQSLPSKLSGKGLSLQEIAALLMKQELVALTEAEATREREKKEMRQEIIAGEQRALEYAKKAEKEHPELPKEELDKITNTLLTHYKQKTQEGFFNRFPEERPKPKKHGCVIC